MFRHYANVIEELQGEPILGAEEQIGRAREAVEEKARPELDALTADLLEHPTISSASSSRPTERPPGPIGVRPMGGAAESGAGVLRAALRVARARTACPWDPRE
jgi:hypothetical protein